MIHTEKRFPDLGRRLTTACILILVALSAWIAGGWAFALLCSATVAIMIWELTGLADWQVSAPMRVLAAASPGAALCVAIALEVSGLALLLCVMAALSAIAAFARRGAIYVAFGTMIILSGLTIIELRLSGSHMFLAWMILTVVATDAGGYFGGRLFGGPRLAPSISPGKRYSGAICAVIFALAAGLAFHEPLGSNVAILTMFLSVCAQSGDLAESWVKRLSGAKDSSTLLPGHGGFLDRFDGFVGAGIGMALLKLSGALAW